MQGRERFLVLVFVCISLLYLLLNADFVATAQILISIATIFQFFSVLDHGR